MSCGDFPVGRSSGYAKKRSWEHVESLPYPDSEESEDDIVYAEECENELQQINLRNEVTNQITVDTCGERCAQLDDFNWVLTTDEWNEKSDTPESEIDTSHSGNGVYVNASDSSSTDTETTTHRLSGSPVAAQTKPKGGCQTAMPRRKHRRRNARTADSTSAMDISQESVAPRTVDSERIHKVPEYITKGSLYWKQLLRLVTEWRSRNVQIAVARTHYLWGVGASVRPDTILRRENLRRK